VDTEVSNRPCDDLDREFPCGDIFFFSDYLSTGSLLS
jgi:hypothetical protein